MPFFCGGIEFLLPAGHFSLIISPLHDSEAIFPHDPVRISGRAFTQGGKNEKDPIGCHVRVSVQRYECLRIGIESG